MLILMHFTIQKETIFHKLRNRKCINLWWFGETFLDELPPLFTLIYPQTIPVLACFLFSVDHDRWVGVCLGIRYVYQRQTIGDHFSQTDL